MIGQLAVEEFPDVDEEAPHVRRNDRTGKT
jgi:hypothetical protein